MDIDSAIQIKDSEFDAYVECKKIRERWGRENAALQYRAGWIYQQILKLLCHRIIDSLSETYVVVDADVMFVRDVYFNPNNFQYNESTKYHIPYKKSYEKLVGEADSSALLLKRRQRHSFISHHMVFNKIIMEELIHHIESYHKKDFVEALLDSIDYEQKSPFSEWDLYGNWMHENHKDKCEHRQLKWLEIDFIPTQEKLQELSNNYDIVCSHSWSRNKAFAE